MVGTIREGRFGDKPARRVFDIASERTDLDFLNRSAAAMLDELAWPELFTREVSDNGMEGSWLRW